MGGGCFSKPQKAEDDGNEKLVSKEDPPPVQYRWRIIDESGTSAYDAFISHEWESSGVIAYAKGRLFLDNFAHLTDTAKEAMSVVVDSRVAAA